MRSDRAFPQLTSRPVDTVTFSPDILTHEVTVTEALRLATNKIDLIFEFIVGVRTSVDPTSETSIDVA